jgi:hypothetical protein
MQNSLIPEVAVLLQAGLLAFHPFGRFQHHGMEIIDVAGEEVAGAASFPHMVSLND